MQAKANYIKKFDSNLIRFFRRALVKTSFNWKTTRFLLRTFIDQNQAVKTRTAHAQRGLQVPPMMIISITNRCNLKCKGCYARAIHLNQKKRWRMRA
jgi:uncharacterized radical SAM superfamily Fe-S cluster-containing enzyme